MGFLKRRKIDGVLRTEGISRSHSMDYGFSTGSLIRRRQYYKKAVGLADRSEAASLYESRLRMEKISNSFCRSIKTRVVHSTKRFQNLSFLGTLGSASQTSAGRRQQSGQL